MPMSSKYSLRSFVSNSNMNPHQLTIHSILYFRCRGSLEIQKTNGQWGVHTTRAFSKGELVISSNLKYSTTTSCAHSIQIGWGEHVLMDLPGRYVNHSCDPNIGVRGLNERNSYDFVALKDLDVNEVCLIRDAMIGASSNKLFLTFCGTALKELTFDYETTEYEVGAFSKCLCGSWNCRGKVCGFKYNGDTIRKRYDEENIASYLL